MVSVRINSEDTAIDGNEMSSLGDVVELIKSHIDPDHMITSISLDGRDLEESDWTANPSQFGTSILEVETGTPQSYVVSRMTVAPDIVHACFQEFQDARKSFQDGVMQEANQKLGKAVDTLQAFFGWYSSLMDLMPASFKNL